MGSLSQKQAPLSLGGHRALLNCWGQDRCLLPQANLTREDQSGSQTYLSSVLLRVVSAQLQ